MKKGILVLLMVGSAAHAGRPVWTITPIDSPVISVSPTGTASVRYTVTNNSRRPKKLVLSSDTPPGISIEQVTIPCPSGWVCALTVNIDGSALPSDNVSGGPIICQSNSNGSANANQCYQPSPGDALVITRTTAPGATTLSASVSTLALSVTEITEYGVTGTPASGVARQITITNTGSNSAAGLNIAYPSWPTGTSATSTCGSSLAAGSSCTITITPGANATSSCNTNQTAPTPGGITVSASNVATSVTTNVVVLGYSCQYQGGYVYAFDDTTPNTGNVGGKVATTSDQVPVSPGVIWSSDGTSGTSADVVYNIIYGISETSTAQTPDPSPGDAPQPVAGQTACNGNTDGSCDSNNIYVYYQNNATNYPINLSYYAAGLCKQTISSYSDWYLPAICEMGYDTLASSSGCGTSGTPTLQNIQSSLIDSSGLSAPAGAYWSSTETSASAQDSAWIQDFGGGGGSGSGQYTVDKGVQFGVRCSRALTL